VDGVRARRQAGSTLKPFFYALALQKKKFDLGSEVLDEPLQIQTPNGAYRPENYDHEFHGWVPLASALAASLNIPAIKVVQEVGVDEAVALLPKLGFHGIKPGYIYGPSIALGSADVTLEELTRAYAGLARQAMGESAGKPTGATSTRFPLDAEAARSVARILSDNPSRSLTFGMNSVLATPYFTAVKTGTSKDMRDNWCVGFSDRYAVGVWVGNFSGHPMTQVSGVSGAAPLWRKVMDQLHRTSPSVMPPAIAAVELPETKAAGAPIDAKASGTVPGPILGSEPSRLVSPKIVYPHSGSVLAVDPGIPVERQKVLLQVSGAQSGFKWILNGREVGPLTEPVLWAIERGKQLLEIRGSGGSVVDSVSFLVK
jgi:penicillin-binding protein 1C